MQETISKILISDLNSLSPVIDNFKTINDPCKICGVAALHTNYGALTCGSCKIFFRRNAVKGQGKLQCQFSGNCEININNRHVCSSCRLAKCFANGMLLDLIRCPRPKRNTSSQKILSNIIIRIDEETDHQLLPTRNLLQSDNSLLTIDQWRILSNLISSYDENKLLSIAQQFINETDAIQNLITINPTLPKEFFMKAYEISGEYLRSNNDLCILSSVDRSAFLRNAANNVICLGTTFIWGWSQLYNYKPFIQVFQQIYGNHLLPMIQSVLKYIDSDIVVAKLSISLFAFSNNISLFSSHISTIFINTLEAFHIQNMYVEVIWKYMIYKYGYYQSIQRFINLIQCFLAAINIVFHAQNIEKHINDIESLVEQTELTLVLDDFERID